MLSADDLAKLKTVGTHTITINVPYYTVPVFVKFTITLYENEEITYTYQLDLGYLRDEVLIDDFDLSLIIIKETDSKELSSTTIITTDWSDIFMKHNYNYGSVFCLLKYSKMYSILIVYTINSGVLYNAQKRT